MGTPRRPLALAVVTVALVCGVAAVAANFGILSQTREVPVGRLLPPISAATTSTAEPGTNSTRPAVPGDSTPSTAAPSHPDSPGKPGKAHDS